MKLPGIDPDGYVPPGPKLGFGYMDIEPKPATGFYQPPNELQVKLAEALPDLVEANPGLDLEVDSYQAWCDLNWEKPHGTVESTARLQEKLLEEVEELQREFEDYPLQISTQDIIGELGDVLWCASGAASNLSVSIKHGLMMLFDRYGRGTRYFDDHSLPAWVRSAQLASYDENMRVSTIDEIVANGYEPQMPTNLLIDKESNSKMIQVQDALNHIDMNSRFLVSILAANYGGDMYQSGATYQADIAEHVVAQIFLDISVLAKIVTRSSLNDVLGQNILKLSSRVATKTVDKTDGPRNYN